MLQEVAQNADDAPVSLTRRTRTDLAERHSRRTAGACDLAPPQFALPAVCNAFICHSQLVPQASSGSALHWSSHSPGVHGAHVLLSQPQLFSQGLRRTAARFHRSVISSDQALANVTAG